MARQNSSNDSTSSNNQPRDEVPATALVHLLRMAQRQTVQPQDLTNALREAGIEATFPPLPPQVGPARSEPSLLGGPASHPVQQLAPLPGPAFTPVREPADGSMASRSLGASVRGQSSTPAAAGTYYAPHNTELSPIGSQALPHSISSLESHLSSNTSQAFNSALAMAGQLLLTQSGLGQPTQEVFLYLYSLSQSIGDSCRVIMHHPE